jgi:hypothetical protein
MNSMSGFRGAAGGNLSNRSAGSFKGDVIPKGYNTGQLAQFSPEQMQLFQQLFSHVGPESFLSKLGMGDEESFQQSEAPAWRQFSEAQGQLGSRFSQLAPGAMSAQRGSGFQNQAGQLGSDFAMNLASRRQDLQRQALTDLMGMSQSLLGQRPYERGLFEKQQHQPSTSSQFGLGAIGALGRAGSGLFGG